MPRTSPREQPSSASTVVRRLTAAAILIVGLGWAFVSAARGRAAVSRWSSPAVVAGARVGFLRDKCVEAALNRLVPAGAPVWPAPNGDWWYILPSLSAPRHEVLERPRLGAYAIEVVAAGAGAPRGVICPGGPDPRADVVLVVRKL